MAIVPNIRINISAPFPAVIQSAAPSLTISKVNGVWTFALADPLVTTNGFRNASNTFAVDINGYLTANWLSTIVRSLTLVNGLNSDIPTPTATRVRITGPTGGFSVGGFVANNSFGGMIIKLYNSTSQQMTIVNEDASSTATNRIKTLTGGNVVLRAGTSFATLSYDVTDQRWILESTN